MNRLGLNILKRTLVITAGIGRSTLKPVNLTAKSKRVLSCGEKEALQQQLQNILKSADKAPNVSEQMRLLGEAIEIGEKLELPHGHKGRLYDMAANSYYNGQDNKKAEACFILAIQNWVQAGVPHDSPPIVEISLKMANIYKATNQLPKAHSGYKWCVDTAKAYLSQEEAQSNIQNFKSLYGITLDALGRFLYETGKPEEALPVIQESIQVAEEIGSSQLTTLQINFSSVLAEMGRHDESIDVLNEIINSNSSEQRAKVTALINKGLLYCIKMDRKDDASLIFKEAVKGALELEDPELLLQIKKMAQKYKISLT